MKATNKNEMRTIQIKYRGRKGYNNLYLADAVLNLIENMIIAWAKAGCSKEITTAPGSINISKNPNQDVTEVEITPMDFNHNIDYKVSITFIAGRANNITDKVYLYNIKYFDFEHNICYAFDKEFFEKNKLINLLYDTFFDSWRYMFFVENGNINPLLLYCADANAYNKNKFHKHTRKLLDVFKDDDEQNELISYAEDSFIRCIIAPFISKRDNRTKKLYYKRLIDKQPPIRYFPNIEEVKSVLLRDLFYQCVENNMGYIDYHHTENGFVFEGYENQYFDVLKKELEEDIKKYNLGDLIEDVDGQYIAGYGGLETKFKFPSGCVINVGDHYEYVFKKGEE